MFVDSGEKKKLWFGSSTQFKEQIHIHKPDKVFPNQIDHQWNSNHKLSYEPHIELLNKKVCVKGKITDNKGVPTMNLVHERATTFMDEASREDH